MTSRIKKPLVRGIIEIAPEEQRKTLALEMEFRDPNRLKTLILEDRRKLGVMSFGSDLASSIFIVLADA